MGESWKFALVQLVEWLKVNYNPAGTNEGCTKQGLHCLIGTFFPWFFPPCFVLILPLGPICTGKFMMLKIILKYGLYLQWAKSPGKQIKADHRIW